MGQVSYFRTDPLEIQSGSHRVRVRVPPYGTQPRFPPPLS
jgi:hypothetical protein